MRYTNFNLGILFIRFALAIVFIAHGWQKLSNMTGTVSFFDSLGLPMFVAYLVMILELLGGILMLLGLCTRYAAVGFVVVMLGVIFTVKMSKGFLGGYEFELTLLLASLAVMMLGPGNYTIRKLFNKPVSQTM
jgi:uncharacterized membrane protein YphA (DoxX/SURF4 family)